MRAAITSSVPMGLKKASTNSGEAAAILLSGVRTLFLKMPLMPWFLSFFLMVSFSSPKSFCFLLHLFMKQCKVNGELLCQIRNLTLTKEYILFPLTLILFTKKILIEYQKFQLIISFNSIQLTHFQPFFVFVGK